MTNADTTPTTEAISIGVFNEQAYGSTAVATGTDLRNVTENFTRDGQLKTTVDTRELFIYKADSALADDGVSVFAPTWAGATGRWELFTTGGGSGGSGGGYSLSHVFDTGLTSGAASGEIRFNNATISSVTEIFINETDTNGLGIASILDVLATTDLLKVSKNDTNYAYFEISGAITDNGTDRTIPVTHMASTGSFLDTDPVAFIIESRAVNQDSSVVSVNRQTLVSNFALSSSSEEYQVLDGGASTRTVDLYTPVQGRRHIIINQGTTNNLDVRDDGLNPLVTLLPGEQVGVLWDTNSWILI